MAELPSGGPPQKGLPLDPGIPGQSTHSKPVDDIRKPDNDDESIYRVDGPDDMTKDRGRIDVNEDNADADTSYGGRGENDSSKTKYPYRDGVPNAHNASFVAELWRLEGAPVRVLQASMRAKVAATADQILTGLDQKFKQRSTKCSATLRRADINNLRWIFSVDCGNGPKAVKIRALPKGNNRKFGNLDLELSCSCPGWQWLGPEYHAKHEAYQLGKQVGTASTPNIRDPERDNRVCKHVAAALSVTRNWEIPKNKMQRVVKKAMKVRRVVKKAMDKRACNVCTAEQVLKAGDQGYQRVWETSEGRQVTTYVRARGDGVEFSPAEYQYRKEGQEWPSRWTHTKDLAGALGRLGFDVQWDSVPDKMKTWLLG